MSENLAGISTGPCAMPKVHYAGFSRRLVSIVYESFLGFSVVFVGALAYVLAQGSPASTAQVLAFRFSLFVVLGCYFIPQWAFRGQTLAMKTWRMRLETESGEDLSISRATLRYLAVWISFFFFGLGFLWALADKNRQFFHDRICGTRIVLLSRSS